METQRRLPMPDTNSWPVFSLDWDDNAPGPTDLSYLLEKPAGAAGFIRIANGHLATGDGRRWRIWGQHLVRAQAVPPMHLAPVIARRLAKFGINCMRLHAIDTHWPDGILMRYTESSRSLDPEALARLDWMVACLKEQGIYVDMNLHVARRFTAADGVKAGDAIGWGKPVLYFDEWLVDLQKEYARQLLEHTNPFTGTRYLEEPAIALIELTNENCLSEFWQAGWLRGALARGKENWGDIHPAYAADLDRRWNERLAQRYPGREALAERWAGSLGDNEDAGKNSVRRLGPGDFAQANRQRFLDEAAFYSGIEHAFFSEMRTFIKDEMGARQLLLGSADHNSGWSGLPMVSANTELELTDSHFYWQHPVDGKITNTPMVDQPDSCAIAHLARGAVEGFPHLCSEVNEPFPNDTAAEYIPILAAYARLQDWDGVFFYDYHPWPGPYWQAEPWAENYQHYWFDIGDNPVKMPQTALGALMFLRGDAQAARKTVERRLTVEWVLESTRYSGQANLKPFWQANKPGRLALMHRVRITSLDAVELAPDVDRDTMPAGAITSDTGELTWETAPGDGRVLVDTPRQQAIIGRAGARATRNLALESAVPFAAVQLASLDDKPIAQADRLLLVVGTRVANTDQTWADDSRQQPLDWGHAPVRISPAVGTLTLRGLEGAKGVTVRALNGRGQPAGEGVLLNRTGGEFMVRLETLPVSTWYSVEVERD